MRCPKCRFDNPDGAKQCDLCGESLTATDSTWGETTVRAGSEANGSERGLWDETVTVPELSGASFQPGGLIASRYQVIRELGRGGMGVVYLVRDQDLGGRLLALKMIRPALTGSVQARRGFEKEVVISQELSHPNIINVMEWGHDADQSFFTMEYLSGQTLRDIITKRKKSGRVFTIDEAVEILDPVLEALDYAHQRTVHRDIKPENIMLEFDISGFTIKLLDFGLAKFLSPSQFASEAHALGTFGYLAPEQGNYPYKVDNRADVFSVGVIFYELVTGQMPTGTFDMRMPSELVPNLSSEVDEIVKNALRGNPDDRYSGAAAFKKELAQLRNTHSVKVSQPLHLDRQEPLDFHMGDSNLAGMVVDIYIKALQKVGRNGPVYVEEGVGTNFYLTLVDGMQFDSGYLSPYFMTDFQRKEAILKKPYILICESRVVLKELLPFLETVSKTKTPLLIIARDIEKRVLEAMVSFSKAKSWPCIAVAPPVIGNSQYRVLEDISIFTGVRVIPTNLLSKIKLESEITPDWTVNDLGVAEIVIVDRNSTTIIEGHGQKGQLGARVEEIRNYLEGRISSEEKKIYMERLVMLIGGVAVITVGGDSESDIKDRTQIVKTFIQACKDLQIPRSSRLSQEDLFNDLLNFALTGERPQWGEAGK